MAKPPFQPTKGLDSPPPIGGAPPQPDETEPDSDDMGGAAKPSPESLHYHDDAQNCGSCEYMGQGGQCQILGMPVQAEGACSAWEGKDEVSQMGAPGGGAPPRGMYGGQ
jgi:hypothetical protein